AALATGLTLNIMGPGAMPHLNGATAFNMANSLRNMFWDEEVNPFKHSRPKEDLHFRGVSVIEGRATEQALEGIITIDPKEGSSPSNQQDIDHKMQSKGSNQKLANGDWKTVETKFERNLCPTKRGAREDRLFQITWDVICQPKELDGKWLNVAIIKDLFMSKGTFQVKDGSQTAKIPLSSFVFMWCAYASFIWRLLIKSS
ncbi:hypothetical protein ACJX0J_012684, partial [Zea mays]